MSLGNVFLICLIAPSFSSLSRDTRFPLVRGATKRVFPTVIRSDESIAITCSGKCEAEFECMHTVENPAWSLRSFDVIKQAGNSCIAREVLGSDLQHTRAMFKDTWPAETIASIGIAMIDILIDLHFRYQTVHGSIGAANVATRSRDATQLVLLNFEHAKSTEDNEKRYTDIRRMLMMLRYLCDGNPVYREFDTSAVYDRDRVCSDIPNRLCAVIDWVFTWPNGWEIAEDVYRRIREQLVKMLEDEGFLSEGVRGVIWEQ